MGGSSSKTPAKAEYKAEEGTKKAPPAQPESVIVASPRPQKWDDKSKWDERSGLRAFCICHHSTYGFMLLEAQKRKKGLHYQASDHLVETDHH